jgi:hypothetical protein
VRFHEPRVSVTAGRTSGPPSQGSRGLVPGAVSGPPSAPVHLSIAAGAEETPRPVPDRRWDRLCGSGRALYTILAAVALLPCYWQPRIQAGDLSSHIYNAWLAPLIQSGRLACLYIAGQSTNVLFDLLLSGLFRLLGPDGAQRAAVTLAVLIFASGAFAFVCAVSGRRAWDIAPCLGVLVYGWVFHMGFFNFYLALGLCFWALALAWRFDPRRLALAAAILLLAYTAHALPVLWAAGTLAYVWFARRMQPGGRLRLLGAALAILAASQVPLHQLFPVKWFPDQIFLATGADQAWVFDRKYFYVAAALLFLWGSQFLHLFRSQGAREMMSSIPLQITFLTAASACLIPDEILIPGYQHTLALVAERISLAAGVSACAALAAVRAHAPQKYGYVATTALFFALMFHDERALNRFEDRIDSLTAQLPFGARVVSPISDPSLRVNALAHIIDRACVGRCFSYANYEPSTGQFRLRAAPGNSYVAATYRDSWELQNGQHVRRPDEPPLLCIALDPAGRFAVREWNPGVLCPGIFWNVFQDRPANP